MCDRQVQVGRRWGADEQFPEHAKRLVVTAKANERIRLQDPERAVGGLDAQQPRGLLERLQVLVPLGQDQRVVVAGRVIVRRKHKDAFEQEFRVVEHVELHPDLRQEAHRLDVVAVFLQEAADHLLREQDVPLREQARGRDHRRRQAAHVVEHGLRRVGFRDPAGLPVQFGQRLPARRQRGIQRHCAPVGVGRAGLVAPASQAMPALLMEAAVTWMVRLESHERCQRVVEVVQVARCDRMDVEHVPVLGNLLLELHRDLACVGVGAASQQRLRALHF